MATSPLSMSPPGEPVNCRQCGNAIEMGSNFCPVCGIPAQGESAPDPLIGRVVADRYRILQLIGRGGMGVVYKVEHTRMGKVMAIKLLHGDLARDQEVQRRFRREAQAASRLSHPATVSIFDFGTSDGLMYLVMEYVSGEDLGRILRSAGYLPVNRAVMIALRACGSLAEAHEQGIVHRDFKPENLLITPLKDGQEQVKLLDFGLAKLREGEDRNEITSAGTLIGTPYYMAPEIIRGNAADHRVDIYALGAVLYRAVAGTPPFTGSSPVAVLTRHLTDELVPPSKRRPDLKIPAAVDAIVVRCMQKEASDRFQTIDEVRDALAEFLTGEGMSDSLLRESGLTSRNSAVGRESKPTRPLTGKMAVATRNDVEDFERRLRRGKVAAWFGVVASLVVAASGGVFFWRSQAVASRQSREAEIEPNNSPDTSTLIGPGSEVHGKLGARLGHLRGDLDFYRLSSLPPGAWRLRVELSPQPNIDTVVELHRAGEPDAVALADEGRIGMREVIAGFRVNGGPYYLSVHEHITAGAFPIENVSDSYALRYSLSAVTPDEEVEPNDREEIAARVTLGTPMRGYIEASGDVDFWCFSEAHGATRIALTAPDTLDLELVLHPRDGAPESVIDAAPVGGAETQRLDASTGRPACVIVRGSRSRSPEARGDADHAYTLRVDPL